MYLKNINYTDDSFSYSKQKVLDNNNSHEVTSFIKSRLHFTHQNITDRLKEGSKDDEMLSSIKFG